MTDFILGFYVDRLDTKAEPHIVWAGFTEEEREAHKDWISVHTKTPANFHNTQAPVVITEPGRYLQANGKVFRVAQIRGVMAYGYVQKPHPTPPMVIWWTTTNPIGFTSMATVCMNQNLQSRSSAVIRSKGP